MTQKNNDDDDNFISLGFLIQKERIRELWKTNKTDRFIYPPHPHKMELLLTRNLVDKHNNYPIIRWLLLHTHTLENSELTCCSTDTHTHTNDCSRDTCGCILVLFFIVSIGNCYPKIKRFFSIFWSSSTTMMAMMMTTSLIVIQFFLLVIVVVAGTHSNNNNHYKSFMHIRWFGVSLI